MTQGRRSQTITTSADDDGKLVCVRAMQGDRHVSQRVRRDELSRFRARADWICEPARVLFVIPCLLVNHQHSSCLPALETSCSWVADSRSRFRICWETWSSRMAWWSALLSPEACGSFPFPSCSLFLFHHCRQHQRSLCLSNSIFSPCLPLTLSVSMCVCVRVCCLPNPCALIWPVATGGSCFRFHSNCSLPRISVSVSRQRNSL